MEDVVDLLVLRVLQVESQIIEMRYFEIRI